jgi:hypothetical protein
MEPAPSTEASPKWVSQKVLASPTRGSSSSEDSAGSSEEASGSSEETGASEEVAGAVEEASGAVEEVASSSEQEAIAKQQKIISAAKRRESFFMFLFLSKNILFFVFLSQKDRDHGDQGGQQ